MKSKPDYWYKQSSVIPFRMNKNSIQLLVIRTRKNNKWIFPKGIIEPGLSPRESAAKEALEEAGVKGELLKEKFGTYKVKKWGGKCKIKVYAINVNVVLDEWEESFRERKWIEIHHVDQYINSPDNLKIVRDFQEKFQQYLSIKNRK